MKLSEYEYTVENRAGDKNGNADGLSKWPIELEIDHEALEAVGSVNAIELSSWTNDEQLKDDDVKQIIE